MIVSRAPGWEPAKKQAPPTDKHHAATAEADKTADTPTTDTPAPTPESSDVPGTPRSS